MNSSFRPTRSLHVKILGPPALFGLICLIATGIVLREAVSRQLEQQIERRAAVLTEVVQQAADVLGESPEFTRMVNYLGGNREVKLIVVAAGQPLRVIAATRNSWAGLPVSEVVSPDVAQELVELGRAEFGHHHHRERDQFGFTAPISIMIKDGGRLPHGVAL